MTRRSEGGEGMKGRSVVIVCIVYNTLQFFHNKNKWGLFLEKKKNTANFQFAWWKGDRKSWQILHLIGYFCDLCLLKSTKRWGEEHFNLKVSNNDNISLFPLAAARWKVNETYPSPFYPRLGQWGDWHVARMEVKINGGLMRKDLLFQIMKSKRPSVMEKLLLDWEDGSSWAIHNLLLSLITTITGVRRGRRDHWLIIIHHKNGLRLQRGPDHKADPGA